MNGRHDYSALLLLFLSPLSCFADQADNAIISKEPTFLEGYWYFPLILAGAFLLFWLISNFRYQLKMKRLAEIEEIRRNAAKDFHDELGSKLSVISMYAQLAKTQMNGHNFEASQYLEKVIHTSNSLYGSMKDLLWTLNPEKDSLQELIYQLRDFGFELFEHSLITFDYKKPTNFVDTKLNMNLKRHILLIFKEAMNNTLKHSHAQHANLHFEINKNHLMVKFWDNGEGFENGKTGLGDGLKNMKFRAAKINADLEIITKKSGTSVVLSCDLKAVGEEMS